MQILTCGTLISYVGEIERGVFPEADGGRELYKITNENGVFYAVTENFSVHEVDSIPEDFTDGKYLWSEESGFTANPNWVDPSAPSEEEQRLSAIEEQQELQAQAIMELAEMIGGTE